MADTTKNQIFQNSFKAGTKDLQQAQQSSSNTKPPQKLTGSFNAGLKDLRTIVNQTKQTNTSNANAK